jgi:hypothetical protein
MTDLDDTEKNVQALAEYARELLTHVYRVNSVADDIGKALRYSFGAISIAFLIQIWLVFAILEAVQ